LDCYVRVAKQCDRHSRSSVWTTWIQISAVLATRSRFCSTTALPPKRRAPLHKTKITEERMFKR
jgi:hypothetical protein